MYDEDYDGPDENDKLFDRIDELVETVKERLLDTKIADGSNTKFVADVELIELMMEEVDPSDYRIYKQDDDGVLAAEVKYKGITFTAILGKVLPESWQVDDKDDEADE
jgi:hypothetical protein